MTDRRLHTTCAYCGVGCGVEIPHAGDRTIQVRGLANHPANQGRLCVKGTHLGEVLPLQQRLLRPTLAGETVSWDTALDFISQKMTNARTETGVDSLGFYLSGQLLTEDYYVANKLAKGFLGTANLDTNSRLCMSSAVAAYQQSLGEDAVPGCYDDIEQADLVILVGSNLAWAHPVLFQRLQAARKARPQMRLVVIDPRATDTSRAADLHLPLKPGTDGRLFNGALAWLSEQGALDTDFIQHHTAQFDETLIAARQHAGTDWAALANDCGLTLADLLQFFDGLKTTPKTVTAWSMGINQSRSGVAKSQAIINLHLATGRIGKVGATPFSITGQPNAMGGREVGGLANQLASHRGFTETDCDTVARFWKAPRIARKPGLKAVDLFEAAARGDIKVLWIMATNPLASLPDANRVREALARVDTVIVSDVVTDNDTLAYADLVLPALAWGEKDGTVTNSERCLSRQRGFLLPPGEAKPDWWALAEVGKRLGFENAFDYAHPAAIFAEHAALSAFEPAPNRQFNLHPLTSLTAREYDDLAPAQWPFDADGRSRARLFSDGRFATTDGRARFIAVAPAEPDACANQLRLNTGRLRDQWHTMTRTGLVNRLGQHRPDFCLTLHPADAAERGLIEGQPVRVRNALGQFIALLAVDTAQRRGDAFAPMHWNATFAAQGGVAKVIPPIVDPQSGQPETKHALVDVEPLTIACSGVYIGDQLPEPLSQGAIWFKRSLGERWLWSLHYSQHTVAEVSERWQCFANDIGFSMTDTDHHWFHQATAPGQSPTVFWLALSDQQRPDPDTDWLLEQWQNSQVPLDDWLAGSPGEADPRGNLICTCHSVYDRDIQGFLAQHSSADLKAVQSALKCSTQCGSCLEEVTDLVGRCTAASPDVESA
ncbi:nitrate reductase [Saccharospirillum impatiens]|uniref:nitrate reductase n=1 Tax=Saccharospirillum impatiens TaxID=169438 RepID=UPI00048D4912|nr:nitrate reductase [Saccharospirillum impatiens]